MDRINRCLRCVFALISMIEKHDRRIEIRIEEPYVDRKNAQAFFVYLPLRGEREDRTKKQQAACRFFYSSIPYFYNRN